MTDASKLPLAGLRVLDLSRALAGPFCAMILADLGAEVIKVEPTPKGEMVRMWGPFKDGISVYYLSIHRNKRSVALNFRDPEGLAVLRQMLDEVDIVVENFKPGVMEEMGLSYETVRERNPGLIFASITGFGRGGPYENWPAVDQIAQGMSGLMSLTGQPESGPTRVGIPIADVVAGMWATIGIQAAVVERQRTGLGQHVQTTLLGGLLGLMSVQGQRQLTLGELPGVAGNDHPVICPYGSFRASDGLFNVAVATEDMWVKLCGLLGLEQWVTDPRFSTNAARAANRDEVKRMLNERFAQRTSTEWTHALVELGIPSGPILNLEQVFSDPHVIQAGMVESIEHPTLGALRLLANPVRLDSMQGRSVRTPPPLLGADTAAVLAEFGLSEERISSLLAANVVQAIHDK